ncbi:MAG: hypothetical protein LBR37_01795 [Erysipelotrichaceae bacterium]|nr:hypothetical protein [Erysipelotrichaceae bacterium]
MRNSSFDLMTSFEELIISSSFRHLIILRSNAIDVDAKHSNYPDLICKSYSNFKNTYLVDSHRLI